MSWLSEAHNEWHTVNGWNVCCPLDCGAGEVYDDYEMYGDEDSDTSVDHAPVVPLPNCEEVPF